MAGRLTIDLGAVVANWRALAARTQAETGAVVKADAYGLGLHRVAPALAAAGVRSFFVAQPSEGAALRRILGPGPAIWVFEGYVPPWPDADLRPLLNSPEQAAAFRAAHPGAPCGAQIDTGMNRLGFEPDDWAALDRSGLDLRLVISHLACADTPCHPQNATQHTAFLRMMEGVAAPRSLAATGGILLGPEHHFDLVRPGIGLYGGHPFAAAAPVVRLSLPVIQTRKVAVGESVGYGAAWTAPGPRRIATLSAGYADGLVRAMGGAVTLWAGTEPCPSVGRLSMDLLTVDVTDLAEVPPALDLLGPQQGIDAVAEAAGTIGYEILTSLGSRYERHYKDGD